MPHLFRLGFDQGQFLLFELGERGGTPKTIEIREAVRFRAYADKQAEKVLKRLLIRMYKLPLLPPLDFLDKHQQEGLRWILSRSRSYLAHAPGAGKTAQAICASIFSRRPNRQTLFIVPPSLTLNWERELRKFSSLATGAFRPSTSIIPETSKAQEMFWGAFYLICPDSMLAKPWVLDELESRRFNVIAVDEASRFKEATSQRTIALFGGKLSTGRMARGLAHRARHTILLDGSPMPNRPIELWAPLYGMAPETIDFMHHQDFGLRYGGATMDDRGRWEFKFSSNEKELHARLTKSFMHIVGEDELSHPERRRSIVFLNKDVRSPEHKEWERYKLPHFNLSDIDEDASQGQLATFRRELGLRKVPLAIKYIQNKPPNESILIFAWHREVCEAIRNSLYGSALVIGGTPADERERAFKKFQAGSLKYIVGNISAMGRGHNLQKADRVIFVESSWTDENNKQCEKRASRRGSTKKFVRCEYLVAPDSMDELILRAVFKKAAMIKKVIG